jgi:hypothetical protein
MGKPTGHASLHPTFGSGPLAGFQAVSTPGHCVSILCPARAAPTDRTSAASTIQMAAVFADTASPQELPIPMKGLDVPVEGQPIFTLDDGEPLRDEVRCGPGHLQEASLRAGCRSAA